MSGLLRTLKRNAHAARIARRRPVAVLGGLTLITSALAVITATSAAADTTHSTTFTYTGSEQSWSVPSGVSVVHIDAIGAAGGGGSGPGADGGGQGQEESADITIPNGTTSLYVEVGQVGTADPSSNFNPTFGGGGGGGCMLPLTPACTVAVSLAFPGASGGGASDVRTCSMGDGSCNTLNSRLVVAAGGGGGGGTCAAIGCTNPGEGGNPATDSAGGAGGDPFPVPAGLGGGDGSFGQGGEGGLIFDPIDGVGGGTGGGGGGGWYGGGGGGSGNGLLPAPGVDTASGGDGGAGSSHTVSGATNVTSAGTANPASVTISYVQYSTTTSVTAMPSSASTFGQPVTYTATISSDGPTPVGSVNFTDNGASLGSETMVGGQASVTVPLESVGTHLIKATFVGNNGFFGSNGSVSHVVNKAPTTTTLAPASTTTTLNDAVTLTATVSTEGVSVAATGTVSFYINGSSAPLATVSLSGDQASLTTTFGGGANSVVAKYSGNGDYLASTSNTASVTVTCQHQLSGSLGSIVASSGTTCVSNASVHGGISVAPGASIDLEHVTINGGLAIGEADQVRICRSTTQAITVNGSTGFVLIGDPTNNCAANTINGNMTLAHNAAGLVVVDNKISGTILSTSNSGTSPLGQPVTISGNHH